MAGTLRTPEYVATANWLGLHTMTLVLHQHQQHLHTLAMPLRIMVPRGLANDGRAGEPLQQLEGESPTELLRPPDPLTDHCPC